MFKNPSKRRQAIGLSVFAGICMAAALQTGFARAAGGDVKGEAAEIKLFQGNWVFTKVSKDGLEIPEEFLKEIKMSFTGSSLALDMMGVPKKANITIDATKKPKEIDLKFEGSDEAGFGIYEFAGDVVKIYASEIKEQRPKDFKADAPLVMILKKAVPEKDAKDAKDSKDAKKGGGTSLRLRPVSLLVPGKTDKDKIQGSWTVVSGVKGGENLPPDMIGKVKAVFDGDKVTIETVGKGTPPKSGTFKLTDASKPHHIDFTIDGETGPGIYEVDGDTLRLCISEPKTARPTEFKSDAGSPFINFVFRRDKTEKKGFELATSLVKARRVWQSKSDRDLIKGTWQPTNIRMAGQTLPDEFKQLFDQIRIEVGDGKISFSILDMEMEGTFALNPSTSPKQIDITLEDSKVQAIYELKGDTVRICGSEPGKARPTSFTSDSNILFEMRRVDQGLVSSSPRQQ